MIAAKFRIASAVGIVLVLVAWTGMRSQRPIAAGPVPQAHKVPKELLVARRDAAKTAWENQVAMVARGRLSPREQLGWSERWLNAELALVETREERIKALADHVERTRRLKEVMIGLWRGGALAPPGGKVARSEVDAATYESIDAVIRYYEVAGKTPPAAKGEGQMEDRGEPLRPTGLGPFSAPLCLRVRSPLRVTR